MLANFLRKIADQIDNKTIDFEDKEKAENFFLEWYYDKLENIIQNTDNINYNDLMKYFTISWFIFDHVCNSN